MGEPGEAIGIVEPVCSRFTEGFDRADLKDAKALLDPLAYDRFWLGSEVRAAQSHFRSYPIELNRSRGRLDYRLSRFAR